MRFGPHGATTTFERGDEKLDLETANNFEIGFDHHGERSFWQLNAYYERVEDHIYLQEVDTGLNADGGGVAASDGVADRVDAEGTFDPVGELLLVDYRQKNAEFYGFEAQMSYVVLAEPFAVNAQVFADKVIGQLTSATNLPRIPPARYGFGIDASRGPLSGNASIVHAMSKDNLGPLETPTNGYTMVTVDLGHRFSVGESGAQTAEIYLQGRNVLDEEGRRATSFLKDVAPLPGASLVVGVRVTI